MSKLSICVLPREHPLNGRSCRVSIGLPNVDFALQRLRSGESAIQALAAEDADFDISDVQPTRVLGRVVEAHAAQQRVRCTLAQ